MIVRGNNREPVFYVEEDYWFYLEKLKQVYDKHQCDVHVYVLMTHHVHLLLTPHTTQSISKVMQTPRRYYVQSLNYACQFTGTLWEGRYKASLIDSERYLLSLYGTEPGAGSRYGKPSFSIPVVQLPLYAMRWVRTMRLLHSIQSTCD